MKIVSLLVCALVLSCQPLKAEITVNELPAVFEATCDALSVPHDVAMAIAQVESGLNPWAINIEGRSYLFSTKEDALAKAQEAHSSGRSFDVGIMQVNSWWLKRFDIPLEAALDPEANIYLGGWILKGEIDRHSTLKSAVGAYHSPNQARANRYANTVMAALGKTPKPGAKRHQAEKQTPPPAAAATNRPAKSKPETVPSGHYSGPMTVISRTAALATPQSMNIYGFADQKTMKVSTGR